MSKRLEGYVDDGHGQPLAGLAVTVSMVAGGLIITDGVTDAAGMWSFTDLPDYDEHFVTIADGRGRAVVRGPWSGEMRDLWIRDRLALAYTAQALLPPGANTWVGGVPLVVDPASDNSLTWTASGLRVPPAGLSQAAADARYEPIDTMYTKAESDTRYVNTTGDTMSGQLIITSGGATITGTVDVTGNLQINGTIIPSAVDHRAIVDTSAASPWLLYNHPPSYARILWRRDQAVAFQVHDMDVNAYLLQVAQTSGNTLIRGTLGVGGAISVPVTGNRLGALGATAFSGALAQSDASAIFYSNSSANWAGIGSDGSGNMWHRTGLSGSPASRMTIYAGGDIDIPGNVGIGAAPAAGRKLLIASASPDSHVQIGTNGPSVILSDNANINGLIAMATSAGQFSLGAGDLMLATYGSARGNIVLNPNYSGGGATRGVSLMGNLGFFGTAPGGRGTITGSRGGNVALAALLGSLAALGLIVDSSTA